MARPFSYPCFDFKTGDRLDPLPFVGVSFGETVTGDDTFTGSLPLTEPAVHRLNWRDGTLPWHALIVVDRLGECVQGYVVTTRKYNSETKSIVVTASTIGSWMKQRLQAFDYTIPNPSDAYWAANPADPTAIAAQVVHDALLFCLTMPVPSIIASSDCDIMGGVRILVNGGAPPSITGCHTDGITQSGSNLVYCFGEPACVVVGSNVAASGLVGGSTITDVTVRSRNPYFLNGTAWLGVHNSSDAIDEVSVNNYDLAPGMLVDGIPGFPLGTTVVSVGSLTRSGPTRIYRGLRVSSPASGTHAGPGVGTIGGWFTVRTSANFTTSSDTTVINFSGGAGPTPSGDWISGSYAKTQFQTVDSIVNDLAGMGYGSGFDYSWDVTYFDGTNVPLVTFNMEYPRKGRVWGSGGHLVLDVAQATKWEYTEDGGSQNIGVIESSGGLGGHITDAFASPNVVTGEGWPPLESTSSHTHINDQSQLNALAQGDLAVAIWPVPTLVITMPLILDGDLEKPGVQFADINVGDDVLWVVQNGNAPGGDLPQDPRFPEGVSYVMRYASWKATIPETGVPTVEFTCEIPPQLLAGGPPYYTPPPRPPS